MAAQRKTQGMTSTEMTLGRSTKIQIGIAATLLGAGMALSWKVGTEVQKMASSIDQLRSAVLKLEESQTKRLEYWVKLLREANDGQLRVPDFPK